MILKYYKKLPIVIVATDGKLETTDLYGTVNRVLTRKERLFTRTSPYIEVTATYFFNVCDSLFRLDMREYRSKLIMLKNHTW